jgi:hypothetical protein
MEDNRTTERQPLNEKVFTKEDCPYCRHIIYEEAKIDAFHELYQHLDKLLDDKLGKYESTIIRLNTQERWLLGLTAAVTGTYFALAYIIIQLSKMIPRP